MACGLLVRQFERCKSAESRINLLHGTPPRYCDVDETRDWSRLSKHENDQFSAWQRQYRKRNADAQEAVFYPQACTFFTYPQREDAQPSASVLVRKKAITKTRKNETAA
jgi:hypothetical protein